MRWVTLTLFLAISPLLAAAEERDANLVKLKTDTALQVAAGVDRLALLQDAVAAGRMEALQAQKSLLPAVGQSLSTLKGTRSPQIVTLIVAYVLSGGDPLVVGRVSKVMDVDPADRRLLDGSTLFMEGDLRKASGLLSKVDPVRLPARICGRIALAQAQLANASSRQERYAVALSAMPGTLIEESALRRSTLSYAEAREEAPFWRRLERYQRRFPNSVFAGNFWKEVTATVAAWASKEPLRNLPRLDVILAMQPVAERRQIYLHLARQAAVLGNSELTVFAAHRLQRLAVEGSTEEQLGLLYSSLYRIVSQNGDAALGSLRSIRADRLGPADKALLAAGLDIGHQIERPVSSAVTSDTGETATNSPLEARGTALLSTSTKLLVELP